MKINTSLFKNIQLSIVAISALILSGCGTTPNYFLDQNATNKIASTEIYATIPQKEITAEIEASQVAAAGGGGLLLALIDVAVESSRANTAEELLQPIKDSLVDIDFNALFVEELNKEISKITWLNAGDVILNADVSENQRADDFDKAKTDAVLFINTSYSLSANFSALNATADVSLMPKSEALKPFSEKPNSSKAKKNGWHMDNNLYRDKVTTSLTLLPSSDKKSNAKALTDDAEKIRSQMRELASSLAAQISTSLQHTRSPQQF